MGEANLHRKVFSGPRGLVKINGEEVGHVTDVQGSVSLENIVMVEIGTPIPPAIVPLGVGVQFSCGYTKMVTEDAVGNRLFPATKAEAILDWPEMEIELLDAVTDEVVLTIVGAMPQNLSLNFGARTIAGTNQSFQARYVIWPSEDAQAA